VKTAFESGATDLSLTLDAGEKFVRRFVVLTDAQLTAVTLWIAHTHAFEAADATPYLHASSAEKRSGKTRLLEVLELLVRSPLPTANISDAALFRAIAKLQPTLLFDEVDAIFGPKARDREDLRGMLNAGYRRGAAAYRMGGAKMATLEHFPVFAAKAFAGIGELPDTIRDRSIRIRLERRTREETIERFRRREVEEQARVIREALVDVLSDSLNCLTSARPGLPAELDDRAQDVWEPLLAIADLAAGGWPERARSAAITLSTGEERSDESLGARLLADIYTVSTATDARRYRTADLIAQLAEIEESPWGDWYGKPITGHGLSKLLKPYGIKTMPVRAEGETVRGYKIEQFENAWARVLGVTSVTAVTSDPSIENASNAGNACNADFVDDPAPFGSSTTPGRRPAATPSSHRSTPPGSGTEFVTEIEDPRERRPALLEGLVKSRPAARPDQNSRSTIGVPPSAEGRSVPRSRTSNAICGALEWHGKESTCRFHTGNWPATTFRSWSASIALLAYVRHVSSAIIDSHLRESSPKRMWMRASTNSRRLETSTRRSKRLSRLSSSMELPESIGCQRSVTIVTLSITTARYSSAASACRFRKLTPRS
jgi:hypothetical protein